MRVIARLLFVALVLSSAGVLAQPRVDRGRSAAQARTAASPRRTTAQPRVRATAGRWIDARRRAPLRAAERTAVTTLVERYRASAPGRTGAVRSSERLRFSKTRGLLVYNPTRPFRVGRRSMIAARVEPIVGEEATEVRFFEEGQAHWTEVRDAPRFNLQDPFVTQVGEEIVFGGVKTYRTPGSPDLAYRTVFYRGRTLADLERFAVGPERMKDIRLTPLPDGRIFVLTRPQGTRGGRGKIGYTILNDLDELARVDRLERAPVIEGQLGDDDWLGANELHVLGNDRIGVLAHVARFDEAGARAYYPAVFEIDLSTGRASSLRLLFERANLPAGRSKRPDLQNVIFSGGLERHGDGTATAYVGAGDAETFRVRIPDPWSTPAATR